MTCPYGGRSARCHGFRPRTLVGLLGPVGYTRHYYHCRACHRGVAPLDPILGLGDQDLTPAAEEIVCLAGVEDRFAVGARKLPARMAGLRVGESTVERATEAAGQRLAQAEHAGHPVGPPTAWEWHRDADGRTVGYVSVDATGVGQQGPGGAKADGRMAYVGMVYNPVPEDRTRWARPDRKRPDWKARYVSQVRPLGDLATPLREHAAAVGLGTAQRVIARSDGGAGREDFLRVNVPTVEAIILDFYHVAEYVAELALYPGDDGAATAWREKTSDRLKTAGGTAVLDDLRGLELKGRPAARA